MLASLPPAIVLRGAQGYSRPQVCQIMGRMHGLYRWRRAVWAPEAGTVDGTT